MKLLWERANNRIWTLLAALIAVPVFVWEIFRRHKALRLILLAILGIGGGIYKVGGAQALMTVLQLVLQLAYGFGFMIFQFVGLFWFISRTKATEIHPGDPKAVTWDSYWGNKHIVQAVQQWNQLLTERGQFAAMGGRSLNGMLLVGPPGTGKTLLAKALAGSGGVAFHGMEGCVEVGTRITTQRGMVRVEDVEIGDLVWTGWDWQRVLDTRERKDRTALRITTRAGYEIVCSHNHPFWAYKYRSDVGPRRNGILRREGKRAAWIDAGELRVGDSVALSFQRPGCSAAPLSLLDAYVLGFYLAEGSITPEYKGRAYTVQFASDNTDLQSIVRRWAEEHGFTFSERPRKISIRRGAVKWMEQWLDPNEKAKTKTIPEVIWQSGAPTVSAFLSGLWDGDGCAEHNYGHLLYHTASRELALGVQVLLGSLGIAATVRSYEAHTTFGDSSMFEVTVSGIWAQKLVEACEFKRILPTEPRSSIRRARLKLAEDGFVWDVIKAIEPTLAVMIDLEVKSTKAFVAGGFVTHNSGFRAMFLGR